MWTHKAGVRQEVGGREVGQSLGGRRGTGDVVY